MDRIIGLDMGTNSVGWAIVESDENKAVVVNPEDGDKHTYPFADSPCNFTDDGFDLRSAGSRIIPMDAAAMGDFLKGNMESAAAVRTQYRSARRRYARANLRRERLLRVLNVMDFLPEHFRAAIDFDQHPGQFKDHGQPLIAYAPDQAGGRRFVFIDAFNEMLADFSRHQPELVADGRRVPYDWTIYYLRQKALHQAIQPQELAWILLNANAKRGYYYQFDDDKDRSAASNQSTKTEEYAELTVTHVEQMEADKKNPNVYWYEVTYDNGATQRCKSPAPPRKVGDKVEVVITTTLDTSGQVKTDRDGKPAIKLRTPGADDWALVKKRTEHQIEASGLTVGQYIYAHLLSDPNVKVKGRLIHTIERRFYKDEITRILQCQQRFMPQLSDPGLLALCVNELYPHNPGHAGELLHRDFVHLLTDDILYYHRPLKSKKSLIADCPYEHRSYVDPQTGEVVRVPLKCIPRSHPLFQEFRLWQFLSNLRIYQRTAMVGGRVRTDVDVTHELLPDQPSMVALYEWLSRRKEVSQDQLLKQVLGGRKADYARYRWNYVEDRTYPCNTTDAELDRRLSRAGVDQPLSSADRLKLWSIAQSVRDMEQRRRAFGRFAQDHALTNVDAFVAAFQGYDPLKEGYGAYSVKATRKLLQLMRLGEGYWSADNIDPTTRQHIDHLIDGEDDDTIAQRVRTMAQEHGLDRLERFAGLSVWQACYVVYNRHSEAADTGRWQTPDDIDAYLQTHLRHGALRNPVVEKVVCETLKVVRDLWKTYGPIDEVHLEMGRDIKGTAQQRADDNERILQNERTNLRIRALLQEFADPRLGIANVRPNSPMQRELLKIYEDTVLSDYRNSIPADIAQIINDLGSAKREKVKPDDIKRYKLWLEQKYCSPYTGKVIPLSRLFTNEYEIEHVIPRSKYFDDSLANKVICETEVNRDKGNMLGYEYVQQHGGQIIQVYHCGVPDRVKVFDKVEYETFVKEHYSHNRRKMERLLMDEIPDGFIQRQLNDSRYMSRLMQAILSHLVREEGEQEAISKHVISTNGTITDRLKADWGLKNVWNQIIAPRFERLNQMTASNDYGQWVDGPGERYFQINVPLEISQHFSTKRIDHRHHALDAIVIACTTRSHINYLNNQAALSSERGGRDDLRRKLCYKQLTDDQGNYKWTFKKPCPNFVDEVRKSLEGIVVSFQQNLRVINKTSNFYTHYNQQGRKVRERQVKGDGWAIRRQMHKETVKGMIKVRTQKTVTLKQALESWHDICDKDLRKEVARLVQVVYRGKVDTKTLTRYFKDRDYRFRGRDIKKVAVWTWDVMAASREKLGPQFSEKGHIDKVTDSGIRTILQAHLQSYADPALAFTPEGIEQMNEHIAELNGGRPHKPVYSVRTAEPMGLKFPVGQVGAKSKKFVEAADNSNLFFAIYTKPNGEREYTTIPFNVAMERQKQGLSSAPETNEKGDKLLFTLSPGDLVYVPQEGENVDVELDRSRIYKMVSCSGIKCHFVPASFATTIVKGFELEASNKMQTTLDGKVSIKRVCVKLNVDRLGRITRIIR